MVRAGLDRARSASTKAAWFAAFRDVALTPSGLQWLESIWRRTDRIAGLTLAEVDEINIALELAVARCSWREILDTQQHERIQNPDCKARFAFVMPALSADLAAREEAFARLRQWRIDDGSRGCSSRWHI